VSHPDRREPPPAADTGALIDILAAQEGVLDELGDLAVELRRALLEPDPEAAEAAAGRAETLVARFELLERERARLEADGGGPAGEEVEQGRRRVARSLHRMLHEGAVSGFTLTRLEDTVAARRAAVASMLGATYLADGRSAGWRATGVSLSAEG
jgi:hypothetical protein